MMMPQDAGKYLHYSIFGNLLHMNKKRGIEISGTFKTRPALKRHSIDCYLVKLLEKGNSRH